MNTDWLFNIIKGDNSYIQIKDNQSYSCNKAIFSTSSNKKILLTKLEKGQWNNYPFKNNDAVFNFLTKISLLSLKTDKNSLVYITKDKEYKHNSDDPVIFFRGLTYENFFLTTGNIVGFIKMEDNILSISSRFGDLFLQYLIADTDGFLELENLGSISSKKNYDWLLAYIWTIKLKKAFLLGLPKTYILKTESTPKVRGNIDTISYTLNKSTGKYRCSYRDHSYKSPALALFIKAYEKLKKDNKIRILAEDNRIYNSLVLTNSDTKYTHQEILATKHFSNPYYSAYNELIDLSKIILRRDSLSFNTFKDHSAFLFDISMLFEFFIKKQLIRAGFNFYNKNLMIETGGKRCNRTIIPDLVLEQLDSIYIFDVKYKHFNFQEGVNREDLFQLHTYLAQYSNHKKIKSCGFIYPLKEGNGKDAPKALTIKQYGIEIPFHILFLEIPQDSDNFQQKMRDSCQNLINKISSL